MRYRFQAWACFPWSLSRSLRFHEAETANISQALAAVSTHAVQLRTFVGILQPSRNQLTRPPRNQIRQQSYILLCSCHSSTNDNTLSPLHTCGSCEAMRFIDCTSYSTLLVCNLRRLAWWRTLLPRGTSAGSILSRQCRSSRRQAELFFSLLFQFSITCWVSKHALVLSSTV